MASRAAGAGRRSGRLGPVEVAFELPWDIRQHRVELVLAPLAVVLAAACIGFAMVTWLAHMRALPTPRWLLLFLLAVSGWGTIGTVFRPPALAHVLNRQREVFGLMVLALVGGAVETLFDADSTQGPSALLVWSGAPMLGVVTVWLLATYLSELCVAIRPPLPEAQAAGSPPSQRPLGRYVPPDPGEPQGAAELRARDMTFRRTATCVLLVGGVALLGELSGPGLTQIGRWGMLWTALVGAVGVAALFALAAAVYWVTERRGWTGVAWVDPAVGRSQQRLLVRFLGSAVAAGVLLPANWSPMSNVDYGALFTAINSRIGYLFVPNHPLPRDHDGLIDYVSAVFSALVEEFAPRGSIHTPWMRWLAYGVGWIFAILGTGFVLYVLYRLVLLMRLGKERHVYVGTRSSGWRATLKWFMEWIRALLGAASERWRNFGLSEEETTKGGLGLRASLRARAARGEPPIGADVRRVFARLVKEAAQRGINRAPNQTAAEFTVALVSAQPAPEAQQEQTSYVEAVTALGDAYETARYAQRTAEWGGRLTGWYRTIVRFLDRNKQ